MSKTIEKLFAIFSMDYGNQWENSRSSDLWPMTVERWNEKLKRYPENIIMEAADRAPKAHKDFPPSIGQFEEICKLIEKEHTPSTGAPVYKINRIEDLTALAGGSEVQKREIAKMRTILAGKLNELQKQIDIPHWKKEHYDRNSRVFKQAVFDERKAWLIKLSETDALNLPKDERYDRICYLREDEADRKLKNIKAMQTEPQDENASHKANLRVIRPTYGYKPWARSTDD